MANAASQKTAKKLSALLGSTYILTIKTQHFHWNITGPLFKPLHELFEEQYERLAAANDDIAERVRALDFVAPGTAKEFISLSKIDEQPKVPSPQNMLKELIGDYESIFVLMRETIALAEEDEDHVTADLLASLMRELEKTVWMMKSSV